MRMKKDNPKNYRYDDHSNFPFKLVQLKPIQEEEKEKAHRHNFFQIFLFTASGGTHLVDFEQSECKTNQIHIVNPGSIHKLNRSRTTEGYVLLFSRTFFDQNQPNPNYFIYRNDFSKFLELKPIDFNRILELVLWIEREQQSQQAFSAKSTRNILELVVIEIQRSLHFEALTVATENDALFDQFMHDVNLNFNIQHSLAHYSKIMHLSPDKLNKICQEKVNKTPSEIIQERILLEAKRLLFHSQLSIKEIAFALGYEDPSYFNRIFKQKVDLTPAGFRANIREKYYD